MRKPRLGSGVPYWRAFVDGGAFPNPGKMGIGVVLTDPDGRTVAQIGESPKRQGTNNEAEYLAVLRALQTALDHGAKDLEVCADSRLTVNTLSGRWRIKAANLMPLRDMIANEAKNFRDLRFRWVPREENKAADKLATEAMGGQVGSGPKFGGTGPKAPTVERSKADGALCGACKKMCTFSWQLFKNGEAHIRQECPTHGFLRYTPKEKPYTELLGPPPRA